jgi:hypothetical protein
LGFIFEETWRSRSALGGSVNQGLHLVKWDESKPATFGNLVCLTKSEAKKHDNLDPKDLESYYSPETIEYIHKRFEMEANVLKVRVC